MSKQTGQENNSDTCVKCSDNKTGICEGESEVLGTWWAVRTSEEADLRWTGQSMSEN